MPAKKPDTFTRPALAIFAVALVVRLVHVWQIRAAPFFTVLMGDSRGYDEWARRIAAGEWLGHEVFYQAPLYPYLLGAIYAMAGRDLLLVRLVQIAIGSASCALLGLAAARLFGRRAGIIAGTMLAVYAPAIFFDGLLQKSVLDVFFVCLALWLITTINAERAEHAEQRQSSLRVHRVLRSTSSRWLALGLAMGGLALTRENALVFIVIILGWIVLGAGDWGLGARPSGLRDRSRASAASLPASARQRFVELWRALPKRQWREGGQPPAPAVRKAVLFVTGLAIVLVPVAARNAYVGGGFYITTSQLGPNFYIGNNPASDGTYQALRYGRGAPEYERQDATELAERALGRTLSPAEVSSYWVDRALDFITSSPRAWFRLMARKAALLVNATEMIDTESQESHAEWSWPLRLGGIAGHFGLLVPLAVIGMIATWPMRARLWVFYAMIAGYAATVVLFYVFARYRYPLVPLLMLFAAAGLATLLSAADGARGARRALMPWAVAAVLAAAIVANWPMLSKTRMRAITETNLAVSLQADGRVDEAVDHYQRAIRLQPDYAPAYNNLGTALRVKGQFDEAASTYRRALALRPDYPEAQYNLANVLTDAGKPAEAIEHFRAALTKNPAAADVRNNMGIALMGQGKVEEAIAEFRAALQLEPDSVKSHRNLADALGSAKRYEEAIEHFRRAAALDPSGAAHYDLGSLFLEVGRPDDAIAAFGEALKATPRSVQAHNNLGIAFGMQGRIDEAIAEFEQALAIDPSFADARRNLALARAQKRP